MDLGGNLSKSFNILFKENLATLLVSTLLAMIISGATFGILAGPMVAGMMALCSKILKGEKGEINEIFNHFDKFVPTLLFMLIMIAVYFVLFLIMLIPILGFLVYIAAIPVIAFVIFFGIGAIVDQNSSPVDALKIAFNSFMKDPVMNWVYVLVFGICAGIGAIACGVGAIVTAPLMYLGMTMAYNELTGKPAA
jgi:hypothetical protein